MRKFKNALPLAAMLLFTACSNEVEHYNGPIVYDNVIVDNYPMLWSVLHQPERGNGAPMLDFITPELPQFNNDQFMLIGTYGGIMALDMETGNELWYYAFDDNSAAVVSDYIISESGDFIILKLSATSWQQNLYIRLNLTNGHEDWRIAIKARAINLNGDCARVGDSHLYLSLLNTSGTCYDAYKLDMQTGDTTRLLHTAPEDDYTHTQCYINTIKYDNQEHWVVTEGLYNPNTEKDIWRVYICNPNTGDTLGYRFKAMPTELPDNVAQKYAPEGIMQINDYSVLIYNTVWVHIINISFLKEKPTHTICDTTWTDSEGIYHQEGCKDVYLTETEFNHNLGIGFYPYASGKSILLNATAPSHIESPTIHQFLNNNIILRTDYKRWIINIPLNTVFSIADLNIHYNYWQTAHKSLGYSNRNIPTTNHNMIDGIFYEAGGSGCLQAFEFESSRQLMKIVLTGSTPVHTGTMAYKNSKGEVFVVFCDRDEVVCFPGLTSSHHKVNMIDLLKNTKNIR